jgi:hypothetical protein
MVSIFARIVIAIGRMSHTLVRITVRFPGDHYLAETCKKGKEGPLLLLSRRQPRPCSRRQAVNDFGVADGSLFNQRLHKNPSRTSIPSYRKQQNPKPSGFTVSTSFLAYRSSSRIVLQDGKDNHRHIPQLPSPAPALLSHEKSAKHSVRALQET